MSETAMGVKLRESFFGAWVDWQDAIGEHEVVEPAVFLKRCGRDKASEIVFRADYTDDADWAARGKKLGERARKRLAEYAANADGPIIVCGEPTVEVGKEWPPDGPLVCTASVFSNLSTGQERPKGDCILWTDDKE